MSANTWDIAGAQFTSGVHSNGQWRPGLNDGKIRRPFARKNPDAARKQGSAKGVCVCGIALPMTNVCDNGCINNF